MLWISGEAPPFLSGFFLQRRALGLFLWGNILKESVGDQGCSELEWRLACPKCPQQVAEVSMWQPQPRSLCGTSSILEPLVYAEILSHAALQ